jgi:hypothetical protein
MFGKKIQKKKLALLEQNQKPLPFLLLIRVSQVRVGPTGRKLLFHFLK